MTGAHTCLHLEPSQSHGYNTGNKHVPCRDLPCGSPFDQRCVSYHSHVLVDLAVQEAELFQNGLMHPLGVGEYVSLLR